MIITNLFSIFDPSLTLCGASWLTFFLVVFILPSVFWLGGAVSYVFLCFFLFLKKEMDCVLSFPVKGCYLLIGSVFIFIGLYNFLALFPHVFSITSHMLVTLPFSYTLWFGIIIFRWVSSIKHFLSHLVPVGTPIALVRFMVVVETLSNLIRPLALTFRLTANMMAGHILISLIGGALVTFSLFPMFLGSLAQFFFGFYGIRGLFNPSLRFFGSSYAIFVRG